MDKLSIFGYKHFEDKYWTYELIGYNIVATYFPKSNKLVFVNPRIGVKLKEVFYDGSEENKKPLETYRAFIYHMRKQYGGLVHTYLMPIENQLAFQLNVN